MLRNFLLSLVIFEVTLSASDWVRMSASGTEVITDSNPKSARECLRELQLAESYFKANPIFPPAERQRTQPRQLTVIVFRSASEFAPYDIERTGLGYFHSGRRTDYIVLRDPGQSGKRALIHEYVHYLAYRAGARLPMWFSEGLAEYYSTLLFRARTATTGTPITGHLYLLQADRILGASDFFSATMNSRTFRDWKSRQVLYAQSWAMVHMLRTAPEYKAKEGELLERLADGEGTEAVLRNVLGISEDELLEKLSKYLDQNRFLTKERDFAPVPAVPLPAQAQLEDSQVSAALVELLTSLGRPKIAENEFRRLTGGLSAKPGAEQARADIAMQKHNDEEARLQLEKAVAAGTANAQGFFDLAMLIREQTPDSPDVERYLKRAIAIDPNHFDSVYFLGYLYMDSGRNADAIPMLERAARLRPSRAEILEYIALTQSALGRTAEATKAIEQAEQAALGPLESARVEATKQLILYPPEPAAPSRPPESPRVPGELRGLRADSKVQGLLIQVDCLNGVARLHLSTAEGKVFLLVDDPGSVYLKNAGARAKEFSCGPVERQPVTVEFFAESNPKLGTAGRVTLIEFR